MFQHFVTTTLACIRLLHASPDAPAVDIYANGSPIIQNFAFGQITQYACARPGMYRITVYIAGATDTPIIDTSLAVSMRMNVTLALAGFLQNIDLLVVQEPPVFLNYANALIRTVALLPDAPIVDVAGNGAVLFSNVTNGMITNYIPLLRGVYTFDLRTTGTTQVLADAPNVMILPGKAYTIFALGLAAGNPPLQLLVAVDANSFKR